jgi:hypothetical protein
VAWDGICAGEALDLCPDTCQLGKPNFTPIACGETICGTAWADGGLRDTDWYEIEITEATEITFSATTTGPLVIGIVDTGGIPDCNLAAALNPFATVPFCGEASFTACLGPGTYWFFAASSQFEGFPCSAGGCNGCPDFNADGMVDGADLGLLLGAWGPGGECFDLNQDGMVDGADLGLLLGAWGPSDCTPGAGNDNTRYAITLECGGECVPPACGVEGTGDCFKANGTPFCDDAECCEIVCGVDGFCCDVAWDAICADEAFTFCIVVELECEPGTTDEKEACGDDTNGGCNSVGEPMFESIDCDAAICGTAWADGIRDTDWYELVLDTDTEITFEGVAEFPLVLGIVDTGGVPDCGLATALNPFITANPGEIASFTACLPAGTHWLFVAPSVFGGFPCDGGNTLYNVFLTCGGKCVPPACGNEGSGDCFEANGTPFCDDNCAGTACEGCCNLICSLDAFCCDVEWDGICADSALQNCGEIEPLLNDTCDDAVANGVDIFEGITEFSTLGATSGGPALPVECDKGFGLAFNADVWYVYTPTCSGLVTVSTCDSASYDTRLAAYSGSCDALELVGCNDDGPGCTGFTSIMEFEAECGVTYFIRVGGFAGAGTGTITLTCDGSACP